MNKGLIFAIVILAIVGGAAIIYNYNPPTSNISKGLSPGFEAFKGVDLGVSVEKIVISKGKEKSLATVELQRKGDGWVLPTSWDYPADKKEVQGLLDELRKIRDGEQRGRDREKSHPRFQVDAERGVAVDLYDKDNKKLSRIIVGKEARDKTFAMEAANNFVRFEDEDQVYEVEAALRNKVTSYPDKVEAKKFLDKVLFKVPEEAEAVRITLVRPDHNVIVEKRTIEPPAEKKDEAKKDEKTSEPGSGSIAEADKDEKKPEAKKEYEYWVTSGTVSFKVDKSKEWDASYLFTRELDAEDAAEKKDPKEYGLDKPHLKVELVCRKKDQKDAPEVKTVILFGNAIKEDKEGAEKGEDKAYYAMIEGEAGGGRIYTVTKGNYTSWNKEVKDFEKPPEPKPEEKKAEETKPEETKPEEKKTEPAPAPPTPPATPPASAGQPAPGSPAPPEPGPAQPIPAQPAPPAPQAPVTPPPAPPVPIPESPAPAPGVPAPAPEPPAPQPQAPAVPPAPPPAK